MEVSRPLTLETINDDVFYEICKAILDTARNNELGRFTRENLSIKLLSMTSRYMRKQLEPILFRSILIDVKSWHLTREALEGVGSCQAIHKYMRRFRFKVHDAAEGSLQSVDGLPKLFATVLLKAQKLEELSVAVPVPEAGVYRLAVLQSGLKLTSVRTLVLGPQMEWMVDLCPHVTKILSTYEGWHQSFVPTIPYSYDFITAAGNASELRHFEMSERWSTELVERILAAMPDIHSLVLTGSLNRSPAGHLEVLLPVLGRFTKLRTLSLPAVRSLRLGYHPPSCGNVYMGPNGAQVRERVKQKRLQAEQKASGMVFTECPQLEVLWLGDTRKSTPTRDDRGVYLESVIVTEDRPKIY
jgi:hypothetical protein